MLIVTGLAGAGKTVALRTLEDLGYYCIDNLPVELLPNLVADFVGKMAQPIAVAIDSRYPEGIARLPALVQSLRQKIALKILFLTASTEVLVRRFSETRRPHPSDITGAHKHALPETIDAERAMMAVVFDLADQVLDTSRLRLAQLKEKIMQLHAQRQNRLILTVQSFGFKHGTPINADFVFDVRFLPNPYWEETLRPFSGRDQPIIDYFSRFPEVAGFVDEVGTLLDHCLPQFSQGGRTYVTVSIGCTGGQHRSVFVAESLAKHLRPCYPELGLEHRDLPLAL